MFRGNGHQNDLADNLLTSENTKALSSSSSKKHQNSSNIDSDFESNNKVIGDKTSVKNFLSPVAKKKKV